MTTDLPLFTHLEKTKQDRAQAMPGPGPAPSTERAALMALRAAQTPAQAQRATGVLCRAWAGRIRALASAWTGPGLDLDDLAQAGTVGLLRAARDADLDRTDQEWTAYAYAHSRKEIERLSRRQGRAVIESEQERRHASIVTKALARDSDLSDLDLAEITGLTAGQCARARRGRRGVDQELVPEHDQVDGVGEGLDPAERERVQAAVRDVLRTPGLAQLLPMREVLAGAMDGTTVGTQMDRDVILGLTRQALRARGVVTVVVFLVLFLAACSAR